MLCNVIHLGFFRDFLIFFVIFFESVRDFFEYLTPCSQQIVYLKKTNCSRDKFLRILAKLAKLNPPLIEQQTPKNQNI